MRQKERKLAEGNDVKEANAKKLKAKKGPLEAKIDALQSKFSKQREKNRLWKLNKKKKNKSGGDGGGAAKKNAAASLMTKNQKKRLKKKRSLVRKKAAGVAVFKPKKGRKGKVEKVDVAME